jgi:hypothetical protein
MKIEQMSKRLIFILFLVSGTVAYSQQNDCKVIKVEISGSYTGGCKNGLAQGKGVAQGIDYYEGQFDKGVPEGRGKYIWADGTYYEGHWENGIRNGSGKMVYRDSIVTGYWKEDKYVGKKLIPSYEIMRSVGVTRSNIKKSIGNEEEIRIKILKGGTENSELIDFNINYSSGDEYRGGNIFGVKHLKFPIIIKINYSTWNAFHTSLYPVVFEFKINEPGIWDVIVSN